MESGLTNVGNCLVPDQSCQLSCLFVCLTVCREGDLCLDGTIKLSSRALDSKLYRCKSAFAALQQLLP
jgi:hypothetical protein